MHRTTKTLKERREAQRRSVFVGREHEIHTILLELQSAEIAHNVINVIGVGGIGKTSLLRELGVRLRKMGLPFASAPIEPHCSAMVLVEHLRHSAIESGLIEASFQKFDELIGKVNIAKGKLQKATESLASGALSAAENLGAVGSFIAGSIGEERIHSWIRKFLSPEEINLLKEADQAVADSLLKSLLPKGIATEPIVLAFDAYEYCSSDMDKWIRKVLLESTAAPDNLVALIFGRDRLQEQDPAWARDWNHLIRCVEVAELRSEECDQYLVLRGISREEDRNDLTDLSCGLPWALELLADTYRGSQEPLKQKRPELSRIIVNRFLDQLNSEQPELRRIVEAASIVKTFDLDMLARITDNQFDERTLEQILRYSFIRRLDQGQFALHDVVRDHVSVLLATLWPERYVSLIRRATRVYGVRRERLIAFSEQWFHLLLEELELRVLISMPLADILPDMWIRSVGSNVKWYSAIERVLSHSTSNPNTEPKVTLFVGHSKFASDELAAAEHCYRAVMDVAVPYSDVWEIATLCRVEALHRLGDVQEAFAIASQAVASASLSINVRSLLGIRAGEMANILGDDAASSDYAEKSLTWLDEVEIPVVRAHVSLLLSHVLIFRNDYAPASAALVASKTACEQAGDDYGTAQVMSASAWLNSLMGNFDQAFREADEALQYFQASNDQFQIGLVQLTLGDVTRRANAVDDACLWNAKAYANFEGCESRLYCTIAEVQWGAALSNAGKYEEARVKLDRAILRSEETGELLTLARALMHRSECEATNTQKQLYLTMSAKAFDASHCQSGSLLSRLLRLRALPPSRHLSAKACRLLSNEAEINGFYDIAALALLSIYERPNASIKVLNTVVDDLLRMFELSVAYNIYLLYRNANRVISLASRWANATVIIQATVEGWISEGKNARYPSELRERDGASMLMERKELSEQLRGTLNDE